MFASHRRDVARFCEGPAPISTVVFGDRCVAHAHHDAVLTPRGETDLGWWFFRGALYVRHHGWDEGPRRLAAAHETKRAA